MRVGVSPPICINALVLYIFLRLMHVCRSLPLLSLPLLLSLSACWFPFSLRRAVPPSFPHHSHSSLITASLFLSDSDPIPHPHFSLSLLFPLGFSHISEMVDPSGKGSEGGDANARNPNGGSLGEGPTMSEQKKTCADCGTSKTPLWRGGPAGPKSLCNACGIKSRKKKRAILGLKGKRNNTSNSSSKIGDSLKQRLMALGREVLMQRSTAERQRKKLGEEEQAAVLLMALSYGSVYA